MCVRVHCMRSPPQARAKMHIWGRKREGERGEERSERRERGREREREGERDRARGGAMPGTPMLLLAMSAGMPCFLAVSKASQKVV